MAASDVERHYTRTDLFERMMRILRESGAPMETLTVDLLAPVDEFHLRGRDGTREVLALLAPQPGEKVLDVGSGVGGPARFIASQSGASIRGVDLTADYVRIATALTERVGLADRVQFQTGDALAMPFADAAFDKAYTIHVSMNIADKDGLFREIARVLKPGGLFVFYDILRGDGEPPLYPAPWASREGLSALATAQQQRDALERAGFEIVSWRDLGEDARAMFSGPPPTSLSTVSVLLGDEEGPVAMANVARGFLERRLAVAQGAARRR